MLTPAQQRERYRGRAWARELSSRDVGILMDALVLDGFDWRDWFTDKPSTSFLAGAFAEVEHRDQIGEFSEGC